jgi:predicted nucleic acid-binding protein
VTEIFLDASYAIALASRTDQHHARAVELAAWLEESQIPLLTTRAVMLEIGNALAKQRDIRIEIVPLAEELYARAAPAEPGGLSTVGFATEPGSESPWPSCQALGRCRRCLHGGAGGRGGRG